MIAMAEIIAIFLILGESIFVRDGTLKIKTIISVAILSNIYLLKFQVTWIGDVFLK